MNQDQDQIQLPDIDLANNPTLQEIQKAVEEEKQEYAAYEAQVEARDKQIIETLKQGVREQS